MLNAYMQELEKIELLAPEQEQALWQLYKQQGDEEARMKLIEHYQPLVFKVAYGFREVVEDVMDCVQEGTVGLIEAVERYDHSRKVAFSLFALHRIRGRILDYLRKEGKKGVVLAQDEEESFWWELLPAEGASTEHTVETRVFQGIVNGALKRLPSQEKLVMEQIYLEDRPFQSVAEEMEKSQSYIYRLHRQGIRRLRGMLSRVRKDWNEK